MAHAKQRALITSCSTCFFGRGSTLVPPLETRSLWAVQLILGEPFIFRLTTPTSVRFFITKFLKQQRLQQRRAPAVVPPKLRLTRLVTTPAAALQKLRVIQLHTGHHAVPVKALLQAIQPRMRLVAAQAKRLLQVIRPALIHRAVLVKALLQATTPPLRLGLAKARPQATTPAERQVLAGPPLLRIPLRLGLHTVQASQPLRPSIPTHRAVQAGQPPRRLTPIRHAERAGQPPLAITL